MPPAVPRATYRVQLSAAFGFVEAAGLVPYLAALGISHLYVSPILKARAGSTHGYDIVDHGALNPEFGGAAGFDALSAALRTAGMGLVLDIVPNHMGVAHADNAWWLDVLEWGPRSPHAAAFDIEWETLPHRASGGVLLPILGTSYGAALEQGELELRYDPAEGSFSVWYYDHRLPIRPDRYGDILNTVVAAAGAEADDAGRALLALAGRHRGPRAPSREEAPALKADLAAIEGGADIIARGLAAYQPDAADPQRTARLHRLLERQHYRLANWRVAFTDINYRRFFDVNDLAGLRMEDPATFAATHRLIAQLVADGHVHGLRLDHIDGLADPAQYTRRLTRLMRAARGARAREAPVYIVAEKILADGEPMPPLPGVAGTTGYEALDLILRVLLDGAGLPRLDALYREVTGRHEPFERVERQAKDQVLDSILASEFIVLAQLLARIAAGHWRTRDFTFERLKAALRAVVVEFPVYRTYVTATASATDRAIIAGAIARARAGWFAPDAELFDFLADVLTLDLVAPGRAGYSRARVRHFVTKFQQLTGPVMAKAVEDTAFYRDQRLIALNEVGSGPERPALSADAFHAAMRARARHPHAMTATATHDTKRGEDARLRILALAEIADDWAAAVAEWRGRSGTASAHGAARAPTPAHTYMLYQALIGAWPATGPDAAFAERMKRYVVKALREGKAESSWAMPNEAYEAATLAFLARVLADGELLAGLDAIGRRTARLGALASLAQLALKATIPGVPDVYQGTEGWDLSLVDPDNRRPVDFAAHHRALEALPDAVPWRALLESYEDGRVKLALTRLVLARRAARPALYADGAYVPLVVSGRDADRVVAFARVLRGEAELVAIARHLAPLSEGGRAWPDFARLDAAVHLDGFAAVAGHLGFADTLFGALPVAIASARETNRPVRS